MTKLTAYTPGQDGRTRTSLNMFGTVTGRASPVVMQNLFLVQVSGLGILLNLLMELG